MKLFTRDDAFLYYCAIVLFASIVCLEFVLVYKENGNFERARVKLKSGRQIQNGRAGRKRESEYILDFDDKEEW